MIATLSGTMLAPGVSKNGRLYTPEVIGKTVARMQARIADPDARPIVMRTHHGAGDDTGRIVGHLTGVTLADDGSAKYEAVLNNTAAARDTLAAVGDEDARSLRNVSIYGWWVGRARTGRHEGEPVETADDLEIDAVDFTAFPGVEGARIDSVTPAGAGTRESAEGRHIVTESVDAELSIVDEAAKQAFARGGLVLLDEAKKKPYGDVKYADPGYQKDKQARYPIDTKDHAKAAWSYVNQAKNAALYNPTQLNAVRARIKGALKKFGVTVTKETVHPAKLLGETALGECYPCDTDDRAGFSISANNGPIHVNISAWDGIDPAELEAIAQAAMQAACDALKALDPDMGGDIDVPGAPNADTDHDMGAPAESAPPPANATPRDMAAFLARKKTTATETTQTPAPTPAGPTVKESAMPDAPKAAETAATTTPAAETAISASQLTAALAEAIKPLGEAFTVLAESVKDLKTPAATPATATENDREASPAANAEKTAETAPPATAAESTTKADVVSEAQKAAKAAVREAIPELLESFGLPRRKGVVRTAESDEQAQTPEQLWANRNQAWNGVLPGGTPAAPIPPAAPAAD